MLNMEIFQKTGCRPMEHLSARAAATHSKERREKPPNPLTSFTASYGKVLSSDDITILI